MKAFSTKFSQLFKIDGETDTADRIASPADAVGKSILFAFWHA